MTDETTEVEVVEPTDTEDTPTDSPTDPDVETQGPQPVVEDNYLSDVEQKVQEQHEALAADLGPGETLPWVAEPPSGVAEERAVEAAEAEDQVSSDTE